jgi:hypothetical protein
MKRLLWPVAAAGAFAFLVALALTGGRGGPGLAPFTPRGLMTMPLEDVREVDVESGFHRLRFVRTTEGWRINDAAATTAMATQLDTALTLLRNSGPERVLSETEVKETDAAQFGLDPPHVRVTVRGRGAKSFAVAFGATNVLGLSHFAKVEGSSEIALLPGYVAEAWERVGKAL